MKRHVLFTILLLGSIFSYAQTVIQDGLYRSPIFPPIGGFAYEFKGNTFTTWLGDVLVCCSFGMTIRGTYDVIGDVIQFKPLPPSYFQKSKVSYVKKLNNKNGYDFAIHARSPSSDSIEIEYELLLYDSLDHVLPFTTIKSNGETLLYSYTGKQGIKRIDFDSFCYERFQLDFDPGFKGLHEYNIDLALRYENIVELPPYKIDILEITSKYIKIKYVGEQLILLKSEFVTDDFLKTGILPKN